MQCHHHRSARSASQPSQTISCPKTSLPSASLHPKPPHPSMSCTVYSNINGLAAEQQPGSKRQKTSATIRTLEGSSSGMHLELLCHPAADSSPTEPVAMSPPASPLLHSGVLGSAFFLGPPSASAPGQARSVAAPCRCDPTTALLCNDRHGLHWQCSSCKNPVDTAPCRDCKHHVRAGETCGCNATCSCDPTTALLCNDRLGRAAAARTQF